MSRLYLTVLLSAFALVACSDLQDLGDLGDPAFVAVILEIVNQDDRGLSFDVDVVEGISWNHPRTEGARVGVGSDTRILVEQPDRSLRIGVLGDLAVGTTIRVWIDTSVFRRTILPNTVTSVRIEILQQEADQ